MRLGSSRLGSSSSRLGGGSAPTLTLLGRIFIAYVLRVLERSLGYFIDRETSTRVSDPATASVVDPDSAAIASARTVTIAGDQTAGITGQPPGYIER